MTPSDVSLLMKKLTAALEQLTPTQINSLLEDGAQLHVTLSNSPKRKVEKPNASFTSDDVITSLQTCTDRAGGIDLLQRLNKVALQTLAKHYDISVDNSINKSRLVDRIVERAVGLRLRQDAFAQLT